MKIKHVLSKLDRNQRTRSRINSIIICLSLIGLSIIPSGNVTSVWIHSLVVDLADADWTLVGEDNGDWAGYFASPAGDVNGDGLGDVLVGAPIAGNKVCPYPLNPDGTCPGLPKGEGVGYLILGREGDLSPDPLNLAHADASFLGCERNSMTARQLYTAGDVNGDGYDDILISGWKCGEDYTGKAYLFLGRPDVETWGRYFEVENADASFLGENLWDFLSYYVATAGDVNADGNDDFLITSTHHEYDAVCEPGSPEDCRGCCKSLNASTERLNIEADTWEITGNLNVERMDHTSVRLGNHILVTGGKNLASYLDSTELFFPDTGIWSIIDSLETARANHSMITLLSGGVLVAGGQNNGGTLDNAERFDPATLSWSPTGSMNIARESHTATLLPDGRVLVVGGSNESGSLASAEIYDPNAGVWTPADDDLATPRFNHAAVSLADGRVLVIGGQNESGFINSAEVFDPVLETWSLMNSLATSRANHTATLISSGSSVLVVGGENETGALGSSEVLDLAAESWTSINMKEARTHHTATLLEDGRVLVIGGQNERGSSGSYEFYTPKTGEWLFGASRNLNTSRANHSAVSIPDGTLLVSGGRNCTDFGKTYLILGRDQADWGADFDLANADASFIGAGVSDRLGRSVAGVGDVDGDGYGDFLISSISSDTAAEDAGENYLFLGRAADGADWWGNDYSVAWADASFVGEAAGDESGRRVSWVGDVNGDDLDDMLMQAALNDYSGRDAGITYLVLGRSSADWGMGFSLSQADASFVGENRWDQAGRRISGAGDVNNDGYNDMLIGAPHHQEGEQIPGILAGKAYVIFGRPAVDWGLYYPLGLADINYLGKPDIGVAGYDVGWINDFNGDGIDDFIIAAFGGRNNELTPGDTYVLFGSETPSPVQFISEILDVQNLPLVVYVGGYWDPNGWADVHIAELRLQEIDGDTELLLKYDSDINGMFLYDNQQMAWLGPCTPGEPGQLVNQDVRLECGGSKIANDANNAIRVGWRIRWLDAGITNSQFQVYLRGIDRSGNDSLPKDYGTWSFWSNSVYIPLLLN